MPSVRGGATQIEVPNGWQGRFRLGGTKGRLPVLQIGNFALPAADDDGGTLAIESLAPGGIYINVLEYEGASDETMWPERQLPLRLNPGELAGYVGGYEGAPIEGHARFGYRVGHRRFVVDVSFGSNAPGTVEIAAAEQVLAGFALVA